MATTPGIIPGISGYREDLRLEEKWWHRLAQVVYTVVAALVVAVVAFIVWKSATPAANLDNATVIASLADVVERSKNPQANAAAILAGMSGSLGLIGANREISYLSDYALRQSFCTSNAHLAVNQVAAFLNERDYTSVNTASNVRWSIPDGKAPIQLCWFGSGIQNVLKGKSWHDVIKYEFTATAISTAKINGIWTGFVYLLVAHFILLTIYYRGFVYVVCGPRKAVIPVARRNEDDDQNFT